MKKLLITILIVLPLTASAVWYNPLTWFEKSSPELSVGGPAAGTVQYVPTLLPLNDNQWDLGTSTKVFRNIFMYNSAGSTRCLQITSAGLIQIASAACGSGGGGGGTGTFSTSTLGGQIIQYPYTSLITSLDSDSTTTSKVYFDPINQKYQIGSSNTASTTIMGNAYFPTKSQGYAYLGTNGGINTVSTSTLAGQVFPFTSATNYNSTSTTLGLLNGFFSTASSTISNNLYLTSLSQGLAYIGSNSLLNSVSTATPVSLNISGNAGTATALAANGGNCSAGNAPLGVDASGAVESCFDVWTEAENTAAGYVANTRTLTVAGTANQITSSAGAQDLSANRTWTLSIPSQFNIQQASTTILSAHWLKVGTTASTTIDTTGNVTIPSGSTLTITGTSDGCANFTSGVLGSTGVACGSGSGTSAYEIATTSDIALSQLAYISKTAGRTTLASVATTTLSCSGGTNCSQAVVIGSSPITVSSFAFPYTANAWGNSTTTTIGLLNGFLSTASSTIVGNATTTGGQYVGSLYGASLTACNSTTQKLLWTADGQFTCGTDAGAGGGMTSFNAGEGLLGGTITDGGTVYSQIGTSTLPTVSQIPYWTSLGSATVPAKLGSVATSSVTINAPLTSAGTPGYVIGGSGWTLDVDDIGAADLAAADFGSFTCNGTTCSLDSGSVSTTNIAGGATNTVLQTNGADIVAWAKLDLANQVTGTLPIANGGTATTTGRYQGIYFHGGDVFRQASTTGLLDYDPTRQLFTTKYSSSTAYASFVSASSTNLFLGTGQGALYTGSGQRVTVVATSTPTVTSPITYSGTLGQFLGGSSGTFDCTSANGSTKGCLTSTDWTTFNSKLSSYDAFSHTLFGGQAGGNFFSATTSMMAIGTSTAPVNISALTVASSTASQLSLSAGAGIAQWTMRNAGGNLYFSTTTTAGTATTSTPALTLVGSGVPSLIIGTSTPSSVSNGMVVLGTGTANASTTIMMGKIQFDGYTTSGSRQCVMWTGSAWTSVSGACTQ